MQENSSGLNAKCFSVKLKLLANRFLHLQFYILHYLKEEGSGSTHGCKKPTQFLVWGHSFIPEIIRK